jgi:hypothetical protein
MKRFSSKALLYLLYGLLFAWSNLFLASKGQTKVNPLEKTGPAVSVEQVDQYYQKQFSGLFEAMNQGPSPDIMRVPTKEVIATLPSGYGTDEASKGEQYYSRYGISYDQAKKLYAENKRDQRAFQAAYRTASQEAKKNGVRLTDSLPGTRLGQATAAKPVQQQAQMISQQQTTVQPQMPAQKQATSPITRQPQLQPSGLKPLQTAQPQPNLASQPATGQRQPQLAGQQEAIQAPTGPQFGDEYYKQYGITLDQAQRLYGITKQNFSKNYYDAVAIAKQNNESISVIVDAGLKSFLAQKQTATQNPLPGRPVSNIWTKSIFAYIPAGGNETIENRADKFVRGTGHFIASAIEKPLGAITLWKQPKLLDMGGYYKENPDADKKFTLLDAVDQVLAHPLVRWGLEMTIIGPLPIDRQNKDIKMRQFIMMLLVTHYNSYKMILSPMGALNFAVNRILFPIRAATSAGKVSMFLMRQALTVFNQYNLNGGDLEQALNLQATNLVFGNAGSILSGVGRATLGAGRVTKGVGGSVISGIGRATKGVAGAVSRGFKSLFKSK